MSDVITTTVEESTRVRHVFPDNAQAMNLQLYRRMAEQMGATTTSLMTDKDGRVHLQAYFPDYKVACEFTNKITN